MFYLAYHLHWSWESVMGMDLGERRAFIRLLSRRIEEENRAQDAAESRVGGVSR